MSLKCFVSVYIFLNPWLCNIKYDLLSVLLLYNIADLTCEHFYLCWPIKLFLTSFFSVLRRHSITPSRMRSCSGQCEFSIFSFHVFFRGYFSHLLPLSSQAYLRSWTYMRAGFSSPCPKYSCSVMCSNEALTLIKNTRGTCVEGGEALLQQVEVCVLRWADVFLTWAKPRDALVPDLDFGFLNSVAMATAP